MSKEIQTQACEGFEVVLFVKTIEVKGRQNGAIEVRLGYGKKFEITF